MSINEFWAFITGIMMGAGLIILIAYLGSAGVFAAITHWQKLSVEMKKDNVTIEMHQWVREWDKKEQCPEFNAQVKHLEGWGWSRIYTPREFI